MAFLRAMRPVWVVAAILPLVLSGCGTERESQTREESRLKPLALLYGQFTGKHRGNPPKDEAEFKAFVNQPENSSIPKSLKVNVASGDELFVSERDGKPYVILYGAVTGPPGPAGLPVVAYEQVGSGGKRYVASSVGKVEDVDAETFKKYVPNP